MSPTNRRVMATARFREAETNDARVLWSTKHSAINAVETDEYTTAELAAWMPESGAISDFRRAIDSETFDVIVAEADGETVGYGVLNRLDERIDAVFVLPEHSRQGIATSPVQQLESRASMGGIAELTLVSSLDAREFYRGPNYRVVETETRAIDGTDLEFLIMSKSCDVCV
ncbi:Acetyltransferase (GNAT) domain-containing protein [Halovenus aranensis]|uniref:Acetyltransferase (GNAT) domain-containing protein n=1 Tax=Halovenus aranensis TaxID=890420 RepID=A0A1G8Y5Y8_9EURY|nr:GNAT family N-acetyltransferase [Halovenus aranensis]SDJ98047.1 Acetyltransferase (GNAT) domain-containing protein [Halovenus aranensis]